MKKSTFFLAVCILSSYNSSAQLCFSPVTNFVGSSPYSITNADFNGDGNMDLATANYGNNSLSVLLGNGLGGFSAATSFTIGGSSYSITSADFNGDNNMDLATANWNSDNISILLGNGAGSFSTATNIVVGTHPNCIISADFNGDGIIDLATTNRVSNNVSVLIGYGTGSFSAATNFTVGTTPFSLVCADFNGDNSKDLAVANGGTNKVFILLGDGAGNFSAGTAVSVGSSPVSIVNGYFNADSNMDLAVLNQGSNTISILLGSGTGTFMGTNSPVTGASPRHLIGGDFDGDGKLDLSVANGGSNNISVFRGNGGGGFASASNFTVSTGPTSLTCADFNSDGKMDLATANYSSNNVSVLLGLITFTTSKIDVSCYGGANGSATVISGTCGLAPYSYSWNTVPVQTTATATGLSAGVYTVTLTDAGNASKTASVTITEPNAPISISTNQTNVSCNGGNNGFASANVSGGSYIYTYSWNTSPIQTYAAVNNLLAGSYILTVTDSKNCIETTSVNITEPLAISVSITTSDVSCNGGNNGLAVAVVNAGTAPYSYSWNTSPIQTSATPTGLSAGNYTLTVTDANSCTKAASISIGQPTILSILSTKTNVTCSGGANGTATATVTGGASPFSYSWNTLPVQNSSTATNLSAGNYTVTVTDSTGCFKTAIVSILQPPPLSAVASSNDNNKCSGACDGTATINATGGTAPYSYLWDTFANSQTSTTASNLCIGTFSVTITDANGCNTQKNVSVAQAPLTLFASTLSTINTKCSGACVGSSTLSVSGGSPPYSFLWGPEANNQTTETATSLCQGIYSVVITDMNGCTIQENSTIAVNTVADPNIYLTNLAAIDQINISPSFAAFYTYNLPASITAPPSNPRNFVDPGKKARFKVECTNEKFSGQSIVSGICKVRSNNPYITITDSSSALNNIGWNDKAWSADEFEINIDPNTPPGTNAYIDFIVQESGQEYSTTCIAIPITPLVYSTVTPFTIDDDNNPDSQGNDNDICDANEIIEFYPWLDNISTLDAQFVRGRFENLDNLSYINIWNGVPGINTTVYDAGWWNYSFAQPQTVASNSFNTTPEYDFVFNYNNTNIITDFKLYMVMAGGFKLFSGNALSLVQWTLPYTFAATGSTSIGSEIENTDGLSFYPNPSNGNVQIQIDNSPIHHVKIYNQIGSLIYQSEKETQELNLTGYPKGVYLIQVQSGDKIFNKKLIIH